MWGMYVRLCLSFILLNSLILLYTIRLFGAKARTAFNMNMNQIAFSLLFSGHKNNLVFHIANILTIYRGIFYMENVRGATGQRRRCNDKIFKFFTCGFLLYLFITRPLRHFHQIQPHVTESLTQTAALADWIPSK